MAFFTLSPLFQGGHARTLSSPAKPGDTMKADWSFRRNFRPFPALYENRPTRRTIPLTQKRHTLLPTLTTLALTLAAGAAAQTAPGFPALFDQASNTYEKGDWVHCGEQFAAAAKAASLDRHAARAGDKEAAFRHLDQAAARGYRDADRVATDPDFDSLRQDPRWKPLAGQVKARDSAARKGPINPELERLYKEDQADRAPDLGKVDWSVVGKRDEERSCPNSMWVAGAGVVPLRGAPM